MKIKDWIKDGWPKKKPEYDYDQDHASWGNADDSFSEGWISD